MDDAPNLYSFATKELDQDATLAYIPAGRLLGSSVRLLVWCWPKSESRKLNCWCSLNRASKS